MTNLLVTIFMTTLPFIAIMCCSTVFRILFGFARYAREHLQPFLSRVEIRYIFVNALCTLQCLLFCRSSRD